VRVLASALTLLAVSTSTPSAGKVAYVHDGSVVVSYLGKPFRQPIPAHRPGAVHWSGDGRLLSIGGWIVGRTRLPTAEIVWAPAGETAAYVTRHGGVVRWTPGGRSAIVADGWGATSIAWSSAGRLALGRSVCRVPCGVPKHQEVWVWRARTLTRVAGPLKGVQRPIVTGFAPGGRALWWSDLEGSASIAADGLPLYANRTRIAKTLPWQDYVATCGAHVAVAAGGDRYAMDGKRILLDGRDVSRDRARSWVSPACSADGGVLVAAASMNAVPPRIGREHRSIWQLLPQRRRLTSPPPGTSDEYPRVLADGSLLFVRTRTISKPLELYGVGTIELLSGGRLTAVGTTGKADNYYGHYAWPGVVAVAT
jgi:hypothetical protein